MYPCRRLDRILYVADSRESCAVQNNKLRRLGVCEQHKHINKFSE